MVKVSMVGVLRYIPRSWQILSSICRVWPCMIMIYHIFISAIFYVLYILWNPTFAIASNKYLISSSRALRITICVVAELLCDFELGLRETTLLPCLCRGIPCWLEQNSGNQVFWKVWSDSTPSSNTGPRTDHTYLNSTGLYIYLEATDVPPGAAAILRTRQFSLNEGGCLTFWYHMYGLHIGTLTVTTQSPSGGTSELWKMEFNQGGNNGEYNIWTLSRDPLYVVSCVFCMICNSHILYGHLIPGS